MLSDEEKQQLEQEFQYALDNIVGKIKGETATAIVVSEQSMILLFRKLMFKIEKQSKEIEELKEERKKYPIAMNDEQYKKVIELAQKDIKEELDKQINVRMINEEYIERNYISKDQIKAKIEELENQKRQWVEDRDNKHKDSEIIYAIEVLQSLLEKE